MMTLHGRMVVCYPVKHTQDEADELITETQEDDEDGEDKQ